MARFEWSIKCLKFARMEIKTRVLTCVGTGFYDGDLIEGKNRDRFMLWKDKRNAECQEITAELAELERLEKGEGK